MIHANLLDWIGLVWIIGFIDQSKFLPACLILILDGLSDFRILGRQDISKH